jgi:hypothetical protein
MLERPRTEHNIIQKGLAFGRDWSGTVTDSGRQGRSEILPRRLVGRDGASVVRRDAAMNRTEDLDVKGSQKANGCIIRDACSRCKAGANDRWRREGPEGRSWLEAIARHRDAAIPHWATIAAMMKATGWQQHSVRGFLAGVVRQRLKLTLASKKVDGTRIYQIASEDSRKSRPRQSKGRPS